METNPSSRPVAQVNILPLIRSANDSPQGDRALADKWFQSLDALQASGQLSDALALGTELQSFASQKPEYSGFEIELLLHNLRLSSILGRKIAKMECIELLSEFFDGELEDKILKSEDLIKYAPFIPVEILISPNESSSGLTGGSELASKYPNLQLSEINSSRVRDYYSSKGSKFEPGEVVDGFLNLIQEETNENQRIFLKNYLFAFLAVNPGIDQHTTMALIEHSLATISNQSGWSQGMLKRNLDEKNLVLIRQAGVDTHIDVTKPFDGSIAAISTSLILQITQRSLSTPISQSADSIRECLLSKAIELSMPEIYGHVIDELSCLATITLTSSELNFRVSTRFPTFSSALSHFARTFANLTRGDRTATEVALNFASESCRVSCVSDIERENLSSLIRSLIPVVTSKRETKDEKSDISLSDLLFQCGTDTKISTWLLSPGLMAFSVIDKLPLLDKSPAGLLTSAATADETYREAQSSLRLIHKQYGARNFMFVALSLALLNYEVKHKPASAAKRIKSFSNLLTLVEFAEASVFTGMLVELMRISRNLGDDEGMISAGQELETLSEYGRDSENNITLGLAAQLHGYANLRSKTFKSKDTVDRAWNWINRSNPVSDRELNLDLNFAILRNLILLEEDERASSFASQTVANFDASTPPQKVRLFTTYLAVLANQMQDVRAESEAWRTLNMMTDGDPSTFYALQASRSTSHHKDPISKNQ